MRWRVVLRKCTSGGNAASARVNESESASLSIGEPLALPTYRRCIYWLVKSTPVGDSPSGKARAMKKNGVKDIRALVDEFDLAKLREIVEDSFSYKKVLRKLGYSTLNGRNSDTLRKRLEYYGISTAHFGYQQPVVRSYDNVFCDRSTASQATLRRWYVRISDQSLCKICGAGTTWNGRPLTMILDHINGNKHDNRIENLRWICPNCNSQLPTFAGRNSTSRSPVV